MGVTSHAYCAVLARLAAVLVCLACLAGCGPDIGKAMERAKAARAKGDNASAEIDLKNVLAERPKDAAAQFLMGQVLTSLGDLPAAERTLQRALEYGHPPEAVLPVLGRVLLDLEKYEEALKALPDVNPAAPTSHEIPAVRGRAHLALGRISEASTQFHVSQTLRPSAAAKLGLAQVSFADGDQAAGDKLLAEALAAEPRNAEVLRFKAERLRVLGKTQEAAEVLREAIAAEPGNVGALLGLVNLELGAGRMDAALPLLKQAEKLEPRSPRLHFAKALVAFTQKRNAEALAELQLVAKVVPDHTPAYLLTGMVQHAEGRYDQAQNALGTYIDRYPGDVAARRLLAGTLLAKGQPHLALNVVAPSIASTRDVGLLAVAAEASRMTGRLGESRALLQRAIALEPRNPALLTNLALTDMAAGSRARAIAGLEAAIAFKPSDSRADETLILLLLAQKEFDRAERVAAALEERLPRSSSSHKLKGFVLLKKNQLPQARASLEQALKLDPANLEAAEALADVDAAEKKPDTRRQRIEAVLKHDPRHVGALLALARLDLGKGQHAAAVASIRQAIVAHPQSINALLMLADVQFRQGQVAEAEISARQAHQMHPNDTRAIALLAETQIAGGDRAGAIVTLTKLTMLQPEVVSGYLRLASAHLAAGDALNARSTVLTALKKEPKHAGARGMLADIYLQTGQLAEASALGTQIQREDPRSALGYRIEGDVLLARKEYARALEAFKKAAAISPSGALAVRLHQAQSAGGTSAGSDAALRTWVAKRPDDVETRFYLADVLSGAGRHREAADQYMEVLKRAPNSARALNNLAWALHALGDKSAVHYARQAVQLFPKSAPAVDTLGWILVQQDSVGEGLRLLLQAVSLDGANPEIRYHLIQALVKVGDTRRAKAELRTLLAGNQPFAQQAEARALAARLGP